MEKLIQQMWSRFLRILDLVEETVSTGSYQDLEGGLSCELNLLGQFILKETFEAIDERLRDNSQERRGWVIERRGDVKEVLSPFGPVRYRRTYFQNKATREYRYLASDRWREQIEISLKQGRQLYHEIQQNLPALRGRRTTLTRALRGLADAV